MQRNMKLQWQLKKRSAAYLPRKIQEAYTPWQVQVFIESSLLCLDIFEF
jgi:hypothetical protein